MPRTRAKHGRSHKRSIVKSRIAPDEEEERQLSNTIGATGVGGSGNSQGQQLPAQVQSHFGTMA